MEGCGLEIEGVEGLYAAISSARKVPVTWGLCSETRGWDITWSKGAFVEDNLRRYCSSCLIRLRLGLLVIQRICLTPLHARGSDAVAGFGGVERVCVGESILVGSSADLKDVTS